MPRTWGSAVDPWGPHGPPQVTCSSSVEVLLTEMGSQVPLKTVT